jgi:hypothetical protein
LFTGTVSSILFVMHIYIDTNGDMHNKQLTEPQNSEARAALQTLKNAWRVKFTLKQTMKAQRRYR